MALFKHILDFKRAALASLRDKRKAKRYFVGPGFPLKATIVLPDTDTTGRKNKNPDVPDAGRNWGGSLFNMSNAGLSLHLPPAAVAKRGEETSVALSLDGHDVKMPCKVAHFRVQASTAYCGLKLEVKDLTQRKAYLQLLEAVVIGSTLAPLKRDVSWRNRGSLRAEQYKSERKAVLTTWRNEESNELHSFELVHGDHCLRGEAKRPALEIYARRATGEKKAWSAPRFSLSEGKENEELRKFFRWIALNTSRPVPTDLREMMRFFAHSRADWKPPPVKTRDSAPATLAR